MKPGMVFLVGGHKKVLFARRSGKLLFADGGMYTREELASFGPSISNSSGVILSNYVIKNKFDKYDYSVVKDAEEVNPNEFVWVEKDKSGIYFLKQLRSHITLEDGSKGLLFEGDTKPLFPNKVRMYKTNMMSDLP